MTCKECKYWNRGGYFEHDKVDWDKHILKTDETSQFGLCLHEKISSDYVVGWLKRSGEKFTDGIWADCDENRGAVETGQDFGCIHFEAK